MNGEEREIRNIPSASPQFAYSKNFDLTESEKMDLIVGRSTPFANALFKLMEAEIVQARNTAMECPPEKDATQRSLMTVAHAMDKFYKNLISRMDFNSQEHILSVRQKTQEMELQDQSRLEEIILKNSRGEV